MSSIITVADSVRRGPGELQSSCDGAWSTCSRTRSRKGLCDFCRAELKVNVHLAPSAPRLPERVFDQHQTSNPSTCSCGPKFQIDPKFTTTVRPWFPTCRSLCNLASSMDQHTLLYAPTLSIAGAAIYFSTCCRVQLYSWRKTTQYIVNTVFTAVLVMQ